MSIEAPARQSRVASLDLIRGLAALEVFLGHLRSFVFVPYTQTSSHGVVVWLVYTATRFGHQAVIIFFVLSGFFIGGSVVEQTARGRWNWSLYAVNRLSRLWVVLIPALLLTLAFDKAGTFLTGGAGYDGRWHDLLNSGPDTTQPITHRWLAFFGNVAFLQTIAVPSYGSNSPLWSLANEFWYYVLFPLLWMGLTRRFILLLPAIAVGLFLPLELVMYGLIWLLGLVSWRVAYSKRFRLLTSRPALLLSLLFLAGSLAITEMPMLRSGADWIVGIATAILVAIVARRSIQIDLLYRNACRIGDLSYSLYVVHFPILAFCAFVFLRGKKFEFGTVAFAVALVFALIALLCCLGFWWFFERNTGRVRKLISDSILSGLPRAAMV